MQKPLQKKKPQAKQAAANKHGKAGLNSKKGAVNKGPKKGGERHAESVKLTKAINSVNEEKFAGVAMSHLGGRLSVIKAPVLSTADEKGRGGKKPQLPGKR